MKKRFSIKGFFKSISKKKAINYLKKCFFMKPKPVGGVKVIYQHCMLLRELGFEAIPLMMGKYKGNFYGYEVECKKYEEVLKDITPSDIIVATEFEPYQGLMFKNAKKVLFVQNWLGLSTRLKNNDSYKSYIDLGYDHVITCSDYCTNFVKAKMNISAVTITNGIDLNKFYPNPKDRVKNKILAMSRKNPDDLKYIVRAMQKSSFEFKVVDGLSQDELIKEYQSADIFLATGYPEGFGLPPLEAMACGCVVVGFTGGGGNEFMHNNQTALIAEDGDVTGVVEKLKLLESNKALLESLRQRGLANAHNYSLEVTKKHLERFFKNFNGIN